MTKVRFIISGRKKDKEVVLNAPELYHTIVALDHIWEGIMYLNKHVGGKTGDWIADQVASVDTDLAYDFVKEKIGLSNFYIQHTGIGKDGNAVVELEIE